MSRASETLAWLNDPNHVRWYTDAERAENRDQTPAERKAAEREFPLPTYQPVTMTHPGDDSAARMAQTIERCRRDAELAEIYAARRAYRFTAPPRAPGELDAIKARLAARPYPTTDPLAGVYEDGPTPFTSKRLPCRCGVRLTHAQWIKHSCGDNL